MFEKITDFDGRIFLNLWGGFSCECFADGINTFVMFYINGKEVLSLSGNDANDVLDFVLSEYYVNENSTIEDGFSTWLMEHYDNVIPSVEPKFHNGEWVANSFLHSPVKIADVSDTEYRVEDTEGNSGVPKIDYLDRHYHLWTIQDAKDGDVLAISWWEDNNFWEKIIIFKKYHNKGVKGLYCMPCVEGYGNTFKNGKLAFNEKVPYYSKTWTCNLHPATKEQRDTLKKAMTDVGYAFDFEKKELNIIDWDKHIKYEPNDPCINKENTANQFKSKENKQRYDIGDAVCTTFDKETEIEDTPTTDDMPLSVLYKTLLKKWKRQNSIIEKQKKEIKKLKDKVEKYSIKNHEMRNNLERYQNLIIKSSNFR